MMNWIQHAAVHANWSLKVIIPNVREVVNFQGTSKIELALVELIVYAHVWAGNTKDKELNIFRYSIIRSCVLLVLNECLIQPGPDKKVWFYYDWKNNPSNH